MTSGTPLPEHEGCGGKLVLPTAIYKNEKNKTVSEKTIPNYWCVKCKQIVKLEVLQK